MSATLENAYCAEAWMDMILLRTDLAQLREYNEGARTRLEQIRHETVLALWEADKALYSPAGHGR
jgi:hypothetical protein